MTVFQSPVFASAVFSGAVTGVARTGLDVLAEAAGWWEADDASNTHDGSTFSQLTDLSGNGNDFVQATAGNQPARLDSSGIISAEFDGTPSSGDDVMVIASPTADLANHSNAGGTKIWVARPDGRGGGGFGRIWAVGDTFDGEWLDTGGAPHTEIFPRWNADMSGTNMNCNPDTTRWANGTKLLSEFRYDESSNDTSTIVAGINGVAFTTAGDLVASTPTGTPVDHSASVFNLGNNTTGNRAFDGGIYALAFWPTILSDADMTLVREHWASKYGVTLP